LYKVYVGETEGKRSLGRLRRRWEDGLKIDFRQTGWDSMEWIHLAQDSDWWLVLVNIVRKLRTVEARIIIISSSSFVNTKFDNLYYHF
jgi:hypothetical protein